MEQNNFKKLFEEEEENYQQLHQGKNASNVWGTLGLFRLVGDLVEIFVPRVMEVFVMAAGGRNANTNQSKGGFAPTERRGIPDPGKIAPSAPDDKNK